MHAFHQEHPSWRRRKVAGQVVLGGTVDALVETDQDDDDDEGDGG
jgi:hypothetical protein